MKYIALQGLLDKLSSHDSLNLIFLQVECCFSLNKKFYENVERNTICFNRNFILKPLEKLVQY